ncbi:MAG: hypothetical protein H6858_08265 [Rhodospirillales bacterium]|nr:hypothetical protein [Alphaproteobacteria bacterium]MCB1840716.1 hypothetical protein [Alphaproteobacteria bacterium]MCB9977574.1 hypothetical protein [Rhodospirillales bacterium]
MKFNFDIECTPEEARVFLGLPNVAPLQEKMMKELEKKMQDNIRTLSPEEMVKTWMPLTIQSMGEFQKIFWTQMEAARNMSAKAAKDVKDAQEAKENKGPSSKDKK